jgi:hypothetical protein
VVKVRYIYNISDTLNNRVDHSALQNEIWNSAQFGFGEIKVMLDYINIDYAASQIFIWMRNALDGYDKLVLDDVVFHHEGLPVSGMTAIEINTLKEEDGRQIVTPSPIGVGWNIWFTGYDDDSKQYELYKQNPFLPSGRGEGRALKVISNGGEVEEEFSFVEPVHIHDGEINWGPEGNWTEDDYFSVGIKFSPTNIEYTPNSGNCTLVSIIDGYNMIIPAEGGDYTVDLDKACPIRDIGKKGYWNIDENTGEISIGEAGQSKFNLFDFAPANAYFMKRIAMANSRRIMEPDVYRTEAIHPNWRIVLSVMKNNSNNEGWLTGWFTCFRKFIQ